MLPGVACVYYGQEISMVDGPIRPEQRQDPFEQTHSSHSRDFSRTPMQWDDSLNAGQI